MENYNSCESALKFSIKVYKELQLQEDDCNFIFSPHGIFAALSIIASGAGGTTLQQITTLLEFKNETDIVNYILMFKDALSERNPNVSLVFTSKVYTNKALRDFYVEKLRDIYNCKVRKFGLLDNLEDCRQRINNWFARHSLQNESSVLQQNKITSRPSLIVADTSMFQSNWHIRFFKDLTITSKFINMDGSSVFVKMMKTEGIFRIYHSELATALELKYEDQNISMWIILFENGLNQIFFDHEIILNLIGAAVEKHVVVSIPQFNIKYGRDYTSVLRGLRLNEVFDNDKANLSRVSYTTAMVLSGLVQETNINIDEDGTWTKKFDLAAKGSVMNFSVKPESEVFVCDRPFHFFIFHDLMKQILFAGKVLKL